MTTDCWPQKKLDAQMQSGRHAFDHWLQYRKWCRRSQSLTRGRGSAFLIRGCHISCQGRRS